jgi:hypothetical protein
MGNYFKKYLLGIGVFLLAVFFGTMINIIPWAKIGNQMAAVLDLVSANSAKPLSGYAWNDNVGWINFGQGGTQTEGRAYISDNKLYGYAWGENIGWISLNCENDDTCGTADYFVSQNEGDGVLTGYAWGENIGWINFNPDGGGVTLTAGTTTENTLTGYAWGENIGWVSFSGDSPSYGVTTYWPQSCTDQIKNQDETGIDCGGSYCTACSGGSNIPICTYDDPVWGTCVDGSQTRTLTATTNPCQGESVKVDTQTCTVATTTPVTISLTVSTTTILAGGTLQFDATVTGTTTKDVTWLLWPFEETVPDFYGTISNSGLYTAPLRAVNVSVIAKSVADPSKSASKDITVKLPTPATPIGITITPANSTILINQTLQFTANVTGTTTNNGADWLILPVETIIENFYGTITSNGLYTAPDHAVNITVRGRAKADGTKTADAKVTVRLAPIDDLSTSTIDTINNILSIDGQNKINPTNDRINNTDHGGGGGDNIVDNIASALDLSSLVLDNVAVLGTTTEKILLEAKRIIETKTGDVVTKTITTAGVVGGGIAASSVLVMNGTVVTDLLFLPFKLWGLLLSFLGLKRRHLPWGTVYDSVTKQPLDPAYITLKRIDGKGEQTSITDLDGRYGFLVTPGKYVIIANRTNYIFPSQRLTGKTFDTIYDNLYFGDIIDMTASGALINKNIPLDPIKFDWNEFVKNQKKLMRFYSRREKFIRLATDWIFRLGFIVSVISLFLVNAPYNLIIFGLYLILTALRKYGLRKKTFGSLTDKEGNPLSYAIIRVIYQDLNTEVVSKVADKIGRYYCLVPKGNYYIKVEKKNDDESYTTVYTSPVLKAENGIINRDFVI